MPSKDTVRIAALGDLHYGRTTPPGSLQPLFTQINDSADILALCGDLTDYGLVEEARGFVKELLPTVKIPIVAVLGNHDFESGQQAEIARILKDAGVATLDGDTTEILGIGFAGVKGFAGGFGRRALGPWGEEIIKKFVHEAVDEALKLESALARLRIDHVVALLHYAPIQATVEGEPLRDLSVPRLQPARGSDHPLPRQRGLPRPRPSRRARRTHAQRRPRLQRLGVADARGLPRSPLPADRTGTRRRPRQDRRAGADRRTPAEVSVQ